MQSDQSGQSDKRDPLRDSHRAATADRLSPRRRWNRFAAGVVIALTAVAAIVVVKWPSLHGRWLESLSTESLRTWEEQAEGDTQAHVAYARRKIYDGLFREASPAAQRALASLQPATPPTLQGQVYALAGYAAARGGDAGSARTYLDRATALRCDDPIFYLGQGVFALTQHRLAEAVRAFELCVAKAPRMLPAWSGLGAALLMGAEPDLALEAYRHVVALAPGNPQSHAMMAEAYAAGRRYGDALRERRAAVDLAPGDPRYFDQLVTTLAAAARVETEYEQAVARLREIMSRNPQDPRLHAMLGGLHLRFARYDLARQEIEASVALAPEVANEWQDLAVARDRAGDRKGSAEAQQRAYRLFDREVDAARRGEPEGRPLSGAGEAGSGGGARQPSP